MILKPEEISLLQPALDTGVRDILLTPGDFLTDPITISNPKVRLMGSGQATRLFLKDGSDDHAIHVTGDYPTLVDFSLDANKQNQSGASDGVFFDGVAGGRLSRVDVWDAGLNCILIGNSSSRVSVSDCSGVGGVRAGLSIMASWRCKINGFDALNCDGDGVDIDAYSNRVCMSHILAEENGEEGVFIEESVKYITLENSIVRGNRIGVSVNQQVSADWLEQIAILGVISSGNRQFGIAVNANQAGMRVRDVTIAECIVMDNCIDEIWIKPGIFVGRLHNSAAKCENVILKGNRSGGQDYGIYLIQGVKGIVAVANNVRGNAITGLQDDGAIDSIIKDNLE